MTRENNRITAVGVTRLGVTRVRGVKGKITP